jgi:hypothetical protein
MGTAGHGATGHGAIGHGNGRAWERPGMGRSGMARFRLPQDRAWDREKMDVAPKFYASAGWVFGRTPSTCAIA